MPTGRTRKRAAAVRRRRPPRQKAAGTFLGRLPEVLHVEPSSGRESLLRATHELLVERSGGPVSLSEITSRAGVNVALVKYHFGSKDGLLLTLEKIVRDHLRGALEELDRSASSPTDKLRVIVEGLVRESVRYPYLTRLIPECLARKDASDPRIAASIDEWLRPIRSWWERLLRDGQKSGEFRKVDATFLLFSVYGACEFIFVAKPWVEDSLGAETLSDDQLDAFVAHTTELILRAISARPMPP